MLRYHVLRDDAHAVSNVTLDPDRPGRCCFLDNECGGVVTDPAINRWGWTSGPYAIANYTVDDPLELDISCGAADCDFLVKGFPNGQLYVFQYGTDVVAVWDVPTSGWTLHLGCGSTELDVYANNNGNPSVALGKFAFKQGLDSIVESTIVVPSSEGFANCPNLWVMAHLCGGYD